jgi:hypothetical protein
VITSATAGRRAPSRDVTDPAIRPGKTSPGAGQAPARNNPATQSASGRIAIRPTCRRTCSRTRIALSPSAAALFGSGPRPQTSDGSERSGQGGGSRSGRASVFGWAAGRGASVAIGTVASGGSGRGRMASVRGDAGNGACASRPQWQAERKHVPVAGRSPEQQQRPRQHAGPSSSAKTRASGARGPRTKAASTTTAASRCPTKPTLRLHVRPAQPPDGERGRGQDPDHGG